MRKTLLVLLLVAGLARAEPTKPVSFDFQGVTVMGFMQSTFKTLLNRDYVISPDVLALDRKITLSVRNVAVADISAFVETVLAGQGVTVTEKKGVYFVSLSKPEPAVISPLSPDGAPVAVVPFARPGSVSVEPVNQVPHVDTEAVIFSPLNRTPEFVVTALVAVFGPAAASASGSLVVLAGSPGQIEKSRVLALALDIAPPSVDVSVSWVEVARSAGSARGVSLTASFLGSKLGVALGANSQNGTVSLRNTNFQVVLDALNTDGRFKQVSNSRMVGDDRMPMSLTVGDETPTISSSGRDNQGNAVQNVVYRPSGVITNVTPRVLGSGRVALEIAGQISSFKPTINGVSGSPTLIKREVKTGVTVNSGDVLLIGGLSDEVVNDTSSALPFLPVSWGVKNSSTVKTDLVLVVSANASKL